MSIGLFGGTFNPIHRGHLWAASEVKKDFKLDQITLIPAALPPHKTPGAVADADDRREMIDLAISDLSGLTVSDVELNRPGPSYTVDTLNELKSELGTDAELYFILGMDALAGFPEWKEPERIISICRLAAAIHQRTGGHLQAQPLFSPERSCLVLELGSLRQRLPFGCQYRYLKTRGYL